MHIIHFVGGFQVPFLKQGLCPKLGTKFPMVLDRRGGRSPPAKEQPRRPQRLSVRKAMWPCKASSHAASSHHGQSLLMQSNKGQATIGRRTFSMGLTLSHTAVSIRLWSKQCVAATTTWNDAQSTHGGLFNLCVRF